MYRLQSINHLSKDEIKNIFDAIDYVFFDVDGVLVHNKTLIPGAVDGVAKLRKLGKKIAFVSNNSVSSVNVFLENLKYFEPTADEIITPNNSLLAYLEKIDFKKDIYVVSSSLSKQLLREAGYNVIEYKDICSEKLEESISAAEKVSLKTLEVCKNVGAVLVDHDYNFSFGSAQAAKILLNHKEDVLFLSGVSDDTININKTMQMIGSRYFIEGLERWTKRKSILLAKPGLALKEVLNSKFAISDDSRVLFIGDNVNTDIAFGVNCGFKTCLALTGITTKDQVEEWTFPESLKPTYVVESIGELYENIKDL